MEVTTLVARILSMVYLAFAAGLLLNRHHYENLLDELYRNTASTYLSGFLALVFGMLIIHFHNRWQVDWSLLVTLVGWLALAKGLLLITVPRQVIALSRRLYRGSVVTVYPWAIALLGLLFAYIGFGR
ncbi:MAG: hypothetical protein ACOC02_04830 [Guyparkeria sp.]|uniref:hypothetical protein n=1 Tax=Guyparkeria sp. TaxID=2035736 RepID=UPI003977FFAD